MGGWGEENFKINFSDEEGFRDSWISHWKIKPQEWRPVFFKRISSHLEHPWFHVCAWLRGKIFVFSLRFTIIGRAAPPSILLLRSRHPLRTPYARCFARVQEMWVTKMTDNGGCNWVTHWLLKIVDVNGWQICCLCANFVAKMNLFACPRPICNRGEGRV